MSVFVVLLENSEIDAVRKRLVEEYPDYYNYHDNPQVFLVRTDDIPEKITNNIGLKGEKKIEGATGAVFKLNSSYAGFTKNAVWDWLNKNNE